MSENLPQPTSPSDITILDLTVQDSLTYQHGTPTTAGYVLTASNTAGNVVWAAGSGSGPTFPDNTFRIYDNVDNTKILAFECSSITTSTTSICTVPALNTILPMKLRRNLLTGDMTWLNVTVTADYNSVYGVASGSAITTGLSNTIVGSFCGTTITTGGANIILGSFCELASATDSFSLNIGGDGGAGSNTMVIGTDYVRAASQANLLYYNSASGEVTFAVPPSATVASFGVASPTLSNTAAGTLALGVLNYVATTAHSNTSYGAKALQSLTENVLSLSNTAVGYSALNSLIAAKENTAVGTYALQNCITSWNTCVGFSAGIALTSGGGNTAIGVNSMINLTTATGCVAVGYQAMAGTADEALITQAVAVGFRALYSLQGVNIYSIGIGSFAGSNITTASGSICIGRESGNAITTSPWIVAIGYQSFTTTTMGSNVGVGYSAGRDLTSGGNNVAIGYQTLRGAPDSTAANSTAVGANALFAVASGADDNTAVGLNAGVAVTTGGNNVLLGSSTAATLTTGTNNIIIGKSANVDANSRTNSIIIGNATRNVPAADNSITIGFNAAQAATYTSCYIDGISGATSATGVAALINTSGQLGTTTSSQRFKDNIQTLSSEITDKIYQLRPVSFTYNNVIEEEKKIPQYGLIAEEVIDVFPDMVVMERDPDAQGITRPHTVQYHKLYALLLAAIHQLKARCDDLESKMPA